MSLGNSRPLAASDTKNTGGFSWLMVTTSGDLTYVTEGDNEITLTAVPAGVWMPVGNATHVKSTGLTASGLIVA